MAQVWYAKRGDLEFGPWSVQQLKWAAASGVLRPDDLVRTAEKDKWVRADDVKGLVFGTIPVQPEPVQEPNSSQPTSPERRQPPPLPTKSKSGTPPLPPQIQMPLRLPVKASRPVMLVGVCILGLLLVCGFGVLVTEGRKSPTAGDSIGGPTAADSGDISQQDPPTIPDFTKVNYDHDFSADDRSLPPGASKAVREIEVETNVAKRWAVEDIYRTAEGKEVLHGKRVVFFDRTKSAKWLEEDWLHGKCHGTQRKWEPTGELVWEAAYVLGEQHGRFRKWYKSGQLWIEGYCYKVKEHGPRTEWHENGKKALEIVYVEDKQQGIRREWWDNGQLNKEEEYRDDKRHGRKTNWDRDGNKVMSGQFRAGEPVGLWTFWFRPKGGGDLYPVQVTCGVWSGGTRAQLLTRVFGMQTGTCYPREGECHLYPPHGEFIRTFGPPAEDVPDLRTRWERIWTYRCSDGELRFYVGTDGKTINMRTRP